MVAQFKSIDCAGSFLIFSAGLLAEQLDLLLANRSDASLLIEIAFCDNNDNKYNIIANSVHRIPINEVDLRYQVVAQWIRREPCKRKIVGSIPVYVRFATRFSKEFNLTMLTKVQAST